MTTEQHNLTALRRTLGDDGWDGARDDDLDALSERIEDLTERLVAARARRDGREMVDREERRPLLRLVRLRRSPVDDGAAGQEVERIAGQSERSRFYEEGRPLPGFTATGSGGDRPGRAAAKVIHLDDERYRRSS